MNQEEQIKQSAAMFGKILKIDDVTATVEINKENMVVPNLLNMHVIFENADGTKILGEVKSVDSENAYINLLGQFTTEKFIKKTYMWNFSTR